MAFIWHQLFIYCPRQIPHISNITLIHSERMRFAKGFFRRKSGIFVWVVCKPCSRLNAFAHITHICCMWITHQRFGLSTCSSSSRVHRPPNQQHVEQMRESEQRIAMPMSAHRSRCGVKSVWFTVFSPFFPTRFVCSFTHDSRGACAVVSLNRPHILYCSAVISRVSRIVNTH